MDRFRADIRYALRTFRANPGLTAVAVLSLAIGIGPNATIFSLVDAIGFRPLQIEDPGHLVAVSCVVPDNHEGYCSYPEVSDIREYSRSFAEIAASSPRAMSLDGGQEPAVMVFGAAVSANYFSVLGVRPSAGRTFVPDEDSGAGQPVAIISERLWDRRFGRDPNVLGRSMRVNRQDLAIVGVMPRSFSGIAKISVFETDIWVPIAFAAAPSPAVPATSPDERNRRSYNVLARLQAGTALAQARNNMEALAPELRRTYPETTKGLRLTVEYEEEARRRPFAMLAMVSLSVAGLVLLVACANVAGLLLGRSEARRGEIAVRLAMGASRGRLLRQLLTESGLLSAMGAALGLVLTYWLTRVLPAFIPPSPIPIALDTRVDSRVLLFTLAAAALAVPAFGLTPALLASRRDLLSAIKGGAGRPGRLRARTGLRGFLVGSQVALSLALLITSGLLVRSYLNTRNIDPGFVRKPMAFGTLAPDYGATRTASFYSQLLDRLQATPGVTATALAAHLPLNSLFGGGAEQRLAIAGHEPPRGEEGFRFRRNIVSSGYFQTMGLRLLAGRDFASTDRVASGRVAIVNRTFADRFWPRADAVGRHMSLLPDKKGAPPVDCEVIGVVQDGKYLSLTEQPQPYIYLPFSQSRRAEMTVIVRGQDEKTLAGTLRKTITSLDRSVPVTQLTTLTEHLQLASIGEQAVAMLVAVIGGFALFLSAIGLYGVVAFSVARRRRELGVRIALGAGPLAVIVDVLRQSGRSAVAGGIAGLALAAAAGRVIASGLYGVSGWDPLTFMGTTVIVALVVLAATYVPARRAARIDPIEALRCE